MWRRLGKIAGAASLVASGAIAAAVATSDDPVTTWKICKVLPARLLRDSYTAASIAFDYNYSLVGLTEGTTEYAKVKHEVHHRSANKLQELCFRNGGIYIKLGQHVGQLEYVVPEEYVQTMRASLLKRCPVSSYEQVCNVFQKELGDTPENVFAEFDPLPLASASLAQVHAAKTHDGHKVAVKVQHTHLTDTAVVDIATVDFVVNFLHRCFPAFDYRWLVDEVRESAPKELDFLYEARNSEKCLENFKTQSPHFGDSIYAPKVFWNLSTSRVLTMEYMDAKEVTDVSGIKSIGIRPHDVSNLVTEAFAEMIFKHGFVHCDPHAANMMVRPLPSKNWNFFGRKRPQLVLLDHGLYKELEPSMRINYAALWKGLVFADAKAIKENSMKLGAGDDLFALFAGVLTMRPWNRVIDPSVDHLVMKGSEGDRSELQMYASQYFTQISELLRRLPRVILLMLKTNDCLRAVNHALVSEDESEAVVRIRFTSVALVDGSLHPNLSSHNVGGSSLESFLIIGRVSSEAVLDAKRLSKRSVFSGLSLWLEEVTVEARLLTMQLALWIMRVRQLFSFIGLQ